MKKDTKEKDPLIKKIERLYHNYGLDTTNMADEEFERILKLYKKKGKDIDGDLRASEQYKDRFANDIV